ncbi:hypothetical protein Mal64_00110 [Pseudobythopirellula maris]|uniref:Uncharacterized protein n=1 Tax=Pseudobythopirellula maris TaxID=2527991 RepID=A0A5C5ZQ64_9BACT|nr:hypothetical protein [Pseudobythopirellula maris]TWT89634.1 hypothetical protein Mal64_00110 [Pseudobythopirellula maris]
MTLPHVMTAEEILQRDFLPLRARLIEVAAMLDRLDRAGGSPPDDERMGLVAQAIARLSEDRDDRAEDLQRLFSLPYDPAWRESFGIESRSQKAR